MKGFLDARKTALVAGSMLATALFAAVGACSDGGDATSASDDDAGSVVPPSDAATETAEGAVDAGSDVTDGALPSCSVDGFCHTNLPKGADLLSVWGDGDGAVWAVSAPGDVLRWDGTEWKIVHQVGVAAYAIWGSGPADIWIGTANGLVHGHGPSASAITFEPVDAPGDASIRITAIWGTGPDDVWAVGGIEVWDPSPTRAKGRVLHLTRPDPGAERVWTSEEELVSKQLAFRSVWGSEATGVWIDGVRPEEEPMQQPALHVHLLRRPKAADGWTSIDLPRDPEDAARPYAMQLFAASTIADTSVWLIGMTGLPKRGSWLGTSSDDGRTFSWIFESRSFWDRTPFAYWAIAANDVWAVGEAGLVNHWDGSTWKQAVIRTGSVPIAKHLRAVWGRNSDDFWVVGEEIALHRTSAAK